MFGVLILYQRKHIKRFSNLHYCTFKNPIKPTCIDLLATNMSRCFHILCLSKHVYEIFTRCVLQLGKCIIIVKNLPLFTIITLKPFAMILQIRCKNRVMSQWHSEQNFPFKTLKELLNTTLHKENPLKKRCIAANQYPFVNKKIEWRNH